MVGSWHHEGAVSANRMLRLTPFVRRQSLIPIEKNTG